MSEKKLQDYIQYYIGCRCLNTCFTPDHDAYDADWILEGYAQNRVKPYLLGNETDETWTDSIKPILRRLADITEEEQNYIATELRAGKMNTDMLTWRHIDPWTSFRLTPDIIHYILNQSLDLFKLIDSGLAIDASTTYLK